jgi:hypothetical protein
MEVFGVLLTRGISNDKTNQHILDMFTCMYVSKDP